MDKTNIFITVIFGVILLSVIFGFIGNSTSLSTQIDNFNTPIDVNANLSLSQSTGQSLIGFLLDNGSIIPSSNYTVNFDTGIINIVDNSTFGSEPSVEAIYTYKAEGYLDNLTVRVLILLIPLFLAIYFMRRTAGNSK